MRNKQAMYRFYILVQKVYFYYIQHLLSSKKHLIQQSKQLSKIIVKKVELKKVMGNQQASINTNRNRNSYSLDKLPNRQKNSYSFDTADFNLDNINASILQIGNHNHISSSLDLKQQQTKLTQILSMPSINVKKSISIARSNISIKQQNAKLQKLTKSNDQLRKQLMEINKKLSDKLQKKKMPILMNQHNNGHNGSKVQKSQKQIQKDRYKCISIKKQLQNAYSEISTYKKQLQQLKRNDSSENGIKLKTVQDKIVSTQQQIKSVLKQIDTMQSIVQQQSAQIKGYQQQLNSNQINDIKRQTIEMRQKLKKFKQLEKKKEKQQQIRHQMLIQLERKLREANGDYLPEFKNYSLMPTTNSRADGPNVGQKSRIIDKSNKKIKKLNQNKNGEKQFRYLPSNLQFEQIESQLRKHKQNHEQFHRKIDVLLKRRNDLKQQRSSIEQKLQTLQKTIENLHYKKDRYMQLIMGNISIGNSDSPDQILSIGDQINDDNNLIIKGQNIQGQIQWNDKKSIKNYEKIVDNLRIITINAWINNKNHIVGFQFYYTDGTSFFVGNKTCQNKDLQQKKTFQLDEGDFLKNIMGTFNIKNKFLQFIVFESNKGKILKIGKQSFKNNNFNLRMGKNQRPATITGACTHDGNYWRINRLDFLIKSSF